MRHAIHQVDQLAFAAQLRFQDGQAYLQLTALVDPQYPPRQRTGDLCGRQLADCRKQPVSMRPCPFAFVVELADNGGAHILTPVVEFFLELVLDHVALFFDHHDFFQALGELPHAFGLERPDHSYLVDAQPDLLSERIVDAENLQRLAHVEI